MGEHRHKRCKRSASTIVQFETFLASSRRGAAPVTVSQYVERSVSLARNLFRNGNTHTQSPRELKTRGVFSTSVAEKETPVQALLLGREKPHARSILFKCHTLVSFLVVTLTAGLYWILRRSTAGLVCPYRKASTN